MAHSLKSLTAHITSVLGHLSAPENEDEHVRMKLLGELEKLRTALETPQAALQKLLFDGSALTAARVAQSMGLFDALARSPHSAQTVEQLHAHTKGDKAFLASKVLTEPSERILRLLYAEGKFVERMSRDSYKPMQLALMLVNASPAADAIKHIYPNLQMYGKFNDYGVANGFQTPGDAFKAPFQSTFDTNKHYFEWLNDHPEEQRAFNSTMAMSRAMRDSDWLNKFPVNEKLTTAQDQVSFADIGGGTGEDILAIREKYPHVAGKMVLEELPQVIDSIARPLPVGVEAIQYDMFTPQPVKSAKVYHLRSVLHDWPDKQALQILGRIREAMNRESTLLLHESTYPDENSAHEAIATAAHVDLMMMLHFASLERTEEQWIQLLKEAGFALVKVWKPELPGSSSTVLFEAKLV
ncbi:MAG: hypothetical protein Q9162_002471 [Coniocarpon cinnabarinum]